MCQTGGPRCFSSARGRLERAITAYFKALKEHNDVVANSDDDEEHWTAEQHEQARIIRGRLNQAQMRYHDALAETAASDEGRQYLRARAAETDALPKAYMPWSLPLEMQMALSIRDELHWAFKAGDYRRHRGQMARQILAADGGVTGVAGTTGDLVVDELITDATRAFATDPASHDKPQFPIHEAAAWLHSQAVKDEQIRKFTDLVKRRADEYGRGRKRLREAQEDVRLLEQAAQQPNARSGGLDPARVNLRRAQESFIDLETTLVLTAEQLKVAREAKTPA